MRGRFSRHSFKHKSASGRAAYLLVNILTVSVHNIGFPYHEQKDIQNMYLYTQSKYISIYIYIYVNIYMSEKGCFGIVTLNSAC